VKIDVRFLSATNRDLPAEVANGTFRRDLFFRLDGVTLVIPPLRERRSMIGSTAMRFLEEVRQKAGAPTGQPAKLGADVLAALERYGWPGNVRELKAVVERAVLLARGGEIAVKHLIFAKDTAATTPVAPAVASTPAPALVRDIGFLDEEQKADRAAVIAALDECAGNQTRAAKKLGIARTTLVTKMRVYRIPRPRT